MKASACPLPSAEQSRITLAHGEGGRLLRQFLAAEITPRFGQAAGDAAADAYYLPQTNDALAFTSDSFVVTPLFFPGGDIGKLAVCGTTNDLVVSGAIPMWLSLSLIIEEGLSWEVLRAILDSIRQAASVDNVAVVTGDTKVVSKGAADRLFINTAGIGRVVLRPPGPTALLPGDVILVSGPVAEHGMAVLTAREELGFDPPPMSDCGSLAPILRALSAEHVEVKAMRDATRGGLAAVLHEWSSACGHSIHLHAARVPVRPHIRGVCELLGIDPLHVANERVMVLAVDSNAAEQVVPLLQDRADCSLCAVVGEVVPRHIAPVLVQREFGPTQALDEPAGAPLPRIC